MEERYITAIDLGTSKIAVAVAKVIGENVQIVYYNESPSQGIKNSSIYNPTMVSVSLKKAVQEAENELKIKITKAVVGLPRYYVKQETANATLNRTDGDVPISREEIEGMKSMALEEYPLNDARKEVIYGAVAQSFSTEDYINQLEKDVVGMVSDTLEGNFKIFVGTKRPSSNIDSAFNAIDLAVAKKYFTPSVMAKACLSEEEIENGVALIDFGAGTTSVTVFQGKIMRHYASIPFGGKSVTDDIKNESTISEKLAENIKLAYGACMPNKLQNLSEKVIEIRKSDNGPVHINVKYMSEVISCRVKEIVDAMLYEIQGSGFADNLRSGIVLTGGGANLTNCSNYIKELSGYNVRIGFPRRSMISSDCNGVFEAEAATVVGMILTAKDDEHIVCATESAPAGVSEQKVATPVPPVQAPAYKSPAYQAPAYKAPAYQAPAQTAKPAAPAPTHYEPIESTHYEPISHPHTTPSEPIHSAPVEPTRQANPVQQAPTRVAPAPKPIKEEKAPENDGVLISPEEYGPEQEKPKKIRRENIYWTKLKKVVDMTVGNLYDMAHEDESK
jgi:cell division protein FtsA